MNAVSVIDVATFGDLQRQTMKKTMIEEDIPFIPPGPLSLGRDRLYSLTWFAGVCLKDEEDCS